MNRASFAPWLAFAFSAALGGISLAAYVVGPHHDAWVPAYLCFLPMAFFFAALPLLQARKDLNALETRVRQLEAGEQPRR